MAHYKVFQNVVVASIQELLVTIYLPPEVDSLIPVAPPRGSSSTTAERPLRT